MRALSGACSVCGGRRNALLPGNVLMCRSCDTAPSGEHHWPRGCPPNMLGSTGGYTVDHTPVTPEE